MKLLLCELLVVWMLGALRAETLNAPPEQTGLSEDEQQVSRRYAESTIASEISKIMDSMLQKNFVDFLLTQREKKSNPAEDRLCNDLLQLSQHDKQKKNIQAPTRGRNAVKNPQRSSDVSF